MSTIRLPDPRFGTPDRDALRADCGNCFALCCTALGFARSADFARDKPAATPCSHLSAEFSCTIHTALRPRGYRGCTVFDCFGAGQNISQNFFEGKSWRAAPSSRDAMFGAFGAARQLHELLWYLAEAQSRTFDPECAATARVLSTEIGELLGGGLEALLAADLREIHARVRVVLMEVSEQVRESHLAGGADHLGAGLHPGADLNGSDLHNRTLHGADLRGAYLIAADLRGSDLSGVDLLGADLRDARLHGADLSCALYLTRPQLAAAAGDASTRLPADLEAPPHWGS